MSATIERDGMFFLRDRSGNRYYVSALRHAMISLCILHYKPINMHMHSSLGGWDNKPPEEPSAFHILKDPRSLTG